MSTPRPPILHRLGRHLWIGAPLAVALALRLVFHVGFQAGDDMAYGEACDGLLKGENVIRSDFRMLRFGLIVPMAVFAGIFGRSMVTFTLYNLLCSLGSVAVASVLGRRLGGDRAGLLAGLALAVVPIAVYGGTYAAPDAPATLAMELAVALFFAGLDATGRRAVALLVGSGVLCALSHATKEWAFFFFVFAAVEAAVRKRWLAFLLPALTFGALVTVEGLVYLATTGDFFWRVHCVRAAQAGSLDMFVAGESAEWHAPLTVLFRKAFGLHHAAFAAAAAFLVLRRDAASRPFLRWWLVFFVLAAFWPARLVPYQRAMVPEPRHFLALLVPSAVVLGYVCRSLPAWGRLGAAGAVMAFALLSNVVVHHNAMIRPHVAREVHRYLAAHATQPVVMDPVSESACRFLSGWRPRYAIASEPKAEWKEYLLVWNEMTVELQKTDRRDDWNPRLRAWLAEGESEKVFHARGWRSKSFRTSLAKPVPDARAPSASVYRIARP